MVSFLARLVVLTPVKKFVTIESNRGDKGVPCLEILMRALISIDYTNDFVADDGKLSAGKAAQAISSTIAEVTEKAFERGDYIFFAIDCHDENDPWHPESKLFPLIILREVKGVSFMVLWTKSINR